MRGIRISWTGNLQMILETMDWLTDRRTRLLFAVLVKLTKWMCLYLQFRTYSSLFHRCKLKNYCNQTTCNSGICSPNYNKSLEGEVSVSSFFCDCTDTGFEGKFCHERVSVIDRVVVMACLSCFIPILLHDISFSHHCICPNPYLRSKITHFSLIPLPLPCLLFHP